MESLEPRLSFLESNLRKEIMSHSQVQHYPKGTEILSESKYIKVLPIVLKGLIKVCSRFDERELLLYYIKPSQSCVMSFSSFLKNQPSRIFAVTEEDSTVLLIPAEKIQAWLRRFPEFSNLFYDQYDLRYTELLDTIQHVLLNKMDERLNQYLMRKSELKKNDLLKLSHSQIANELGTVREVVSRVIKKLEIEGKVAQTPEGIKILRQ